jgi:O-antigen/teichoic acid export membrane protein
MLKNVVFMGMSTFVRLLTGVVVFVILARLWGPAAFGTFMFWSTSAILMALVVDFGFGQYMLRESGRSPERCRELTGEVLLAKLALALPVGVLALGMAVYFEFRSGMGLLVLLLAGSAITFSFSEFLMAPLRAVGAFHEETKIIVVANLTHFGLVAGLGWLGFGLAAVAGGFLASRLFHLVVAWRRLTRVIGRPTFPAGSGRSVRRTLRAGVPYGADAGLTNLYSNVDTLIVNAYLGPAAVGIYQAGMRLMQGANTFAPVLSNVYLAPIAKEGPHGPAFPRLARSLFLSMLLAGTVAAAFFVFGAELVVDILYGEAYRDLTELMPLIGALLLIRYVAASSGVLLTAVGLQSARVYVISAALLVLLALAAWLVPWLGLRGMLIGAIAATTLLLAGYLARLLTKGIPVGIDLRIAAVAFVVLLVGITFAMR